MFIDLLLDALIDSLKLLPFLLLIYALLEWLEHRASDAAAEKLARAGRFGPAIGAALGCVPQCGFSVAAVKLWQAGLISLGTLLAALLATSDEALPVLLAAGENIGAVWKLLGVKLLLGIAAGFLIDLLWKRPRFRPDAETQEQHQHDHAHCEGHIWRPAWRHTLSTLAFIFAVTLALNVALEWLGQERLAAFLLSGRFAQPFLSALLGFIPNCAASVLLTELYISGSLSFGATLAGLGTGAGLGLMLLYKSRDLKQTLKICGLLYAVSVAAGLLLIALKL